MFLFGWLVGLSVSYGQIFMKFLEGVGLETGSVYWIFLDRIRN